MNDEIRFANLLDGLPLRAKEEALAGLKSFVSYLTQYNNGAPLQQSAPVAPVPAPTPTRRESFERTTYPNPVSVASDPQPAPQPAQELKKELPVKHSLGANRAAYRGKLVRAIWSPMLRSELVDRIVALKESGVPEYEITAAIQNAKQEEQASGKPVWKSVGAWCKQKYITLGVEWIKCAPDTEPKPEPLAPVVVVQYSDEHGRRSCVQTRELTEEQALELSDMIEAEDGRYTAQEIKDRISRFAKGETVNQYRYAC